MTLIGVYDYIMQKGSVANTTFIKPAGIWVKRKRKKNWKKHFFSSEKYEATNLARDGRVFEKISTFGHCSLERESENVRTGNAKLAAGDITTAHNSLSARFRVDNEN